MLKNIIDATSFAVSRDELKQHEMKFSNDFNEKKRNIIDLKDAKVSFIKMKSFDNKIVAENIKILEKPNNSNQSLSTGTVLSGTIKNFTDFGIFIKINGHKDGLINKNVLPADIKNRFKEIYSLDQKIKVIVDKVSERGIELKIKNE